MSDDMPREDVVAVLDGMVEELLELGGLTEPPVDAIVLAQRHLGLMICLDRQQQDRGRVQRAGGRPAIYLRPEPTEERHQWTVAHEIGEHLKPQLLERLGWTADEARQMTGESLATLFSSRLLVPTLWFRDDARAQGYDVLDLKKRYHTASHQVIALRMLDLPEPCIITILDNGAVSKRKSNGPRITRDLEPLEKKVQEYVNRYSRPRTVSEGAWTVQGWPIHQPDWKREILRSVVTEE